MDYKSASIQTFNPKFEVGLGAGWQFWCSFNFSLTLNSWVYNAVITFYLLILEEKRYSYLTSSFVMSSVIILLGIALHESRCCWLLFSALQRGHRRLLLKYFCLRFSLQSVVLYLRAWRCFTSSLEKIVLVTYLCISSEWYSMWQTFECFFWISCRYLNASSFIFFFTNFLVYCAFHISYLNVVLFLFNNFEIFFKKFYKITWCWVECLFLVYSFSQFFVFSF